MNFCMVISIFSIKVLKAIHRCHLSLTALGFFHMQSSLDRDEHLKIEWKHIIKGMESNFNKYNSSVVTDFGVKYDYNSIMHYGAYAFTKDGYATIVPHVSPSDCVQMEQSINNNNSMFHYRISRTSIRSVNGKN